jgi:hypothetical protein
MSHQEGGFREQSGLNIAVIHSGEPPDDVYKMADLRNGYRPNMLLA